MPLNYVTLTGKIPGGTTASMVLFTPSNWIADPGDTQLLAPVPVAAHLTAQGTFSVSLLATDNTGITPTGWYWTVAISGVPAVAFTSWSFFLANANGATQDISGLVQITPPPPQIASLPLPGGTPQSGYVPVATGSGETTVWASPGAASIPLTTFGDTLYEDAIPTPVRLPGNTTATRKFLRQQGNGTISAAPAWDTLQAGDIPALAYDASGAAAAAQAASLQKSANLSDLASAATARTNLGLGTAATQASSAFDAAGAAAAAQAASVPLAGGTMTGWLAPSAVALTFAATVAVNAALGNAFNLTLTASTATLGAPSNPVDGQVIRIRVTQAGAGSFTLGYNAAYDFGAAGAPTLSTAVGKVDILGFEYVASISKWAYVGSGLGF